MGEHARRNATGEEIKIGTCENLYYLRADQVHFVTALPHSVDPIKDAESLRFRFPFPSEDDVEVGNFDDYDRQRRIYGVKPPAIEHYTTQFKATNDNGYLVSLPCPESDAYDGNELFTIHRNGYGGAVGIVQQRIWNGLLVTVGQCRGCGARFRYETLNDVQPVLDALASEAAEQRLFAERNDTPGNADIADQIDEFARRIVAGYEPDAVERTFGRSFVSK